MHSLQTSDGGGDFNQIRHNYRGREKEGGTGGEEESNRIETEREREREYRGIY